MEILRGGIINTIKYKTTMVKISKIVSSVGPRSKPSSIATTKTDSVKNSTKTFSTGPRTKPTK